MRDAQRDIDAIAHVRNEFLKSKTESVFYREEQNLIDEAPIFSEDVNFDSTDCVLTAEFGPPAKFIFKNKSRQLVVSVSLPKGVTLQNPEHVQNALSKLYTRVKYYTSAP
jgi:hypothetical protein